MTELPITPPVSPEEIAKAEATAKTVTADVTADVAKVEEVVKKAKADKSPIYAAAFHVAILLATALYMHLPSKDVAILGSVVSLGSGYFVTVLNYVKGSNKA